MLIEANIRAGPKSYYGKTMIELNFYQIFYYDQDFIK